MTAKAELPPGIALVRLAIEAPDETAFRERLARLPADHPVRTLGAAHPGSWGMVKRMLSTVDHGAGGASPAAHMRRIAGMFDRAARLSPEASVALYSLGDRAALAQATAEVIDWLDAHGLLDPNARVLDIGCGIGRLELALAGRVGQVTGTDVSPVMLAEARQRCAGLANVTIMETAGTDLAAFAAGSLELAIALDSFPYVVAAGGGLAGELIREAARVLVPGGRLAIFNYAYEGGPEEQIETLRILARDAGLLPREMGGQPFRHWDGRVFLMVKPRRPKGGGFPPARE